MTESKYSVTEADLKQKVERLRCSNAVLQTENEMFESFLSRLDALSLSSTLAPQVHGGKSKRGEMSQEPPNHLKLEQKYYIAVCVLEETRKEQQIELQQDLSISLSRKAEYYKAAIKDSAMRLEEVKRERHDFERFVAKTGERTQVVAQRVQKVIKYIERKIKVKKSLTERKRRRNAFLQIQNKKQQRVVHQKEQMQDTFRDIDLEHLKQNNIKYREILQKSQEKLLHHRMLIRKSQQGLSVYKERLKKEMQELESLSRKITSHEEKLSKIRKQQQKVEKERAQAEALNNKLKAQLANFRVPDVTKYVEAKATNDQFRQTVKALERRARIAEMASKTKKRSPEDSSCCSTSDGH